MRRAAQDWGPALVLAGLFVVLAAANLQLPGLYYDEALDAVPGLRLIQGREIEFSRNASLELFGRRFPLMVIEYVGPVNTYLTAAAFSLFGASVEVLRMIPILCSAIVVGLIYRLGSMWFSRWVGVGAALLLALSPSFIFWSRQGFHVTSVMALFLFGGLLAFILWWRSDRPAWFILGALAFGLGLTAKLLFLWAIVGLPLAALAAWGVTDFAGDRTAAFDRMRRRLRPATIVAGLAAFVLGAAPLLIYNLQTGGTIDLVTSNLVTTGQGVNNLDFVANLASRLRDLRAIMDGAGQFWFLGDVIANPVVPWVAGIGAGLALGLTIFDRGSVRYRGPVVFLVVFMAAVLVMSSFTLSGLGATHLFILIPIPLLLLVAGLWIGARAVRKRLAGRGYAKPAGISVVAGATAIVALVALSDLRSDLRYHETLATTGGYLNHSDMIAEMGEWLVDRDLKKVVTVDWGFGLNLEIVTRGELVPVEIFLTGVEAPPLFLDLLRREMNDPENVYVFHEEGAVVFPREALVREFVANEGKELIFIDTFAQRDGKIIARLMRIE